MNAVIDPGLFLAFLGVAALLTVTPGVDTMLVLRAATRDGPGAATRAACGIALGCLVWGLIVALGLGAVVAADTRLFTLIRWAGALWLAWVGTRLLLHPRQGPTPESAPRDTGMFRQGLITNLLNPKVGVFYLTFLPQFIPTGANAALAGLALTAGHVMLTALWFAVLIAATAPIARALRRASVIRWLDRVCGVMFLGFGVRLALD